MNIAEKLTVVSENVPKVYMAGAKDFGLKGKGQGEFVQFDNVHPIEHTVEVRLGSKNLFNKDNANIISTWIGGTPPNGTLNAATTTKSLYIPCLPNTTYTVSKILSARFGIGFTAEVPTTNTVLTNVVMGNAATALTRISPTNAKYLVVWFYHSNYDTEISAEDIINSLQIEYGTTPTAYTPYISDFRAIPIDNNLVSSGFSDNAYGMSETKPFTLEKGKTYKGEIQFVDGVTPSSVFIEAAGWGGDHSPGYILKESFEFTHQYPTRDNWAMYIYGSASNVASVSLVEVGAKAEKPIVVTAGGKNLLNINREQGVLTSGNANTSKRTDFEFDKYYVGMSANNYYYPDIASVTVENGLITLTSTDNAWYGIAFPIKVTPNATYTVSGEFSENTSISVFYYDNEGNHIPGKGAPGGLSFTVPDNITLAVVDIVATKTYATATAKNIQIEKGATATEYEPYKELVEYTANADGRVEGVKSIFPTMNISTDTEGVRVSAECFLDPEAVVSALTDRTTTSGGV